MRSREFWVMDYETIVNCFVAVFESYNGTALKTFVVGKHKNDIKAFVKFLIESKEAKDWHLGYNNIAFDAQITEFILANKKEFLDPSHDGEYIAERIYEYAQYVIGKADRGEFLDYPEFKMTIRCVDIYKLNHWDSNAKRTSLKWTQFSMNWDNVEEMPHPHYERVNDVDTLDLVVKYCINDVRSTKAIFNMKDAKGNKTMASQINLRAKLSETYNVNLFSASEPKISKEIFLHFLSEKLGIDKRVIKELRTYRSNVTIRDIILPYVKFETPEFNAVHNWFKNLVVDTVILDGSEEDLKKKGPKHRMVHKGVVTDYALGGIHGCAKPGIYEPAAGRKILSVDVTSYYPNLAIRNKWSPAQINKHDFCELYEWFFEERKKYLKSDPLNYLFKIVLNSTYGLSKSKYSFLYDPELTFRITVNGQLLLSMLYEMISTRIPNAQPLMQNTDGLEFDIDEKDEELFFAICKEWEEMTQLQLESVEYKKMIIGDVNNYIAIYKDGKTKCKGRFEYDELPLHKNKSNLIVPKAWYQYFVNGIDPADYLKSNRDIFDYCAGAKIKGNWYFVERGVDKGEFFERKLQKLVRYFVSKKGTKLIKCHPDGRQIQLESGPMLQSIFNKVEMKPWDEYEINEKYYLDKIYDEIKKIESKAEVIPSNAFQQLKLEL
jgi:hypothetical protein